MFFLINLFIYVLFVYDLHIYTVGIYIRQVCFLHKCGERKSRYLLLPSDITASIQIDKFKP